MGETRGVEIEGSGKALKRAFQMHLGCSPGPVDWQLIQRLQHILKVRDGLVREGQGQGKTLEEGGGQALKRASKMHLGYSPGPLDWQLIQRLQASSKVRGDLVKGR